MLAGSRLMIAPEPTPVPLSVTLCGVPLALSEMTSAAEWAIFFLGAKITVICVLAPGATVIGRAPAVRLNSDAPEIDRSKMRRVPVPALLTSTVTGVLLVFTCTLPKSMLAGLMLMTAPLQFRTAEPRLGSLQHCD